MNAICEQYLDKHINIQTYIALRKKDTCVKDVNLGVSHRRGPCFSTRKDEQSVFDARRVSVVCSRARACPFHLQGPPISIVCINKHKNTAM